jgi:hypothetical protein
VSFGVVWVKFDAPPSAQHPEPAFIWLRESGRWHFALSTAAAESTIMVNAPAAKGIVVVLLVAVSLAAALEAPPVYKPGEGNVRQLHAVSVDLIQFLPLCTANTYTFLHTSTIGSLFYMLKVALRKNNY